MRKFLNQMALSSHFLYEKITNRGRENEGRGKESVFRNNPEVINSSNNF